MDGAIINDANQNLAPRNGEENNFLCATLQLICAIMHLFQGNNKPMMVIDSLRKSRMRLEMVEQARGASSGSKSTPPRQNSHGPVQFLAKRPSISLAMGQQLAI
jgi:hypothetical protein